MIHRVKYFFETNNYYVSVQKENIEEVKQDAREYKKNHIGEDINFLFFKLEDYFISDKKGNTVYSSTIQVRDYEAEEEIND